MVRAFIVALIVAALALLCLWAFGVFSPRTAELHPGPDGSLMAKPPDMSDGEWTRLGAQERDVESRKKEAMRRGEAALREFDRALPCPSGKRALTLTEKELFALQDFDPSGKREWTYRCPCCGSPKTTTTAELRDGVTLLLDADKPNPWQGRAR